MDQRQGQVVSDGRAQAGGETAAEAAGATSDDAFLGGALTIRQPRQGYRAGLDAVLLAASVGEPAFAAGTLRILDAGAGVGVVGLCVARRIARAEVTLVEVQPAKAALAAFNARVNRLDERVRVVTADVTAAAGELETLGLAANAYDGVVMNPPYREAGAGTPSADPGRDRAHAMPERGLEAWVRFAVRSLRPGGRVFIVHTAAALPEILAALSGRFGGVVAKPVQARPGEDAIRVLVCGIKGSRAPFRLAAPFVVHDPSRASGFTAEAEAVLREGAGLARWW